MARPKSTPHRSPAFPGDRELNIPRTVTATEYTQTEAGNVRLGVSYDHELAIPTDWASRQLAVRKAQHHQDLAKAGQTLDAFCAGKGTTTEGETVDRTSLDWAKAVGLKEQDIAEAEEREKKEKARDAFEKSYPVEQRTGLTAGAAKLFQYLKEHFDDDSDSDLSTVSDVSALDPDSKGKEVTKAPRRRITRTSRHLAVSDSVDGTPGIGNLQDLLSSNPAARAYHRALATIQYEDTPPAHYPWLTGLRRPLPYPDLTDLENFEIMTRQWVDDVSRIERQRAEMPDPGEGA